MDETWTRRTAIGAVIVVIVGAALTALAFGGGQTSRILSTVGAAANRPISGGNGSGSGPVVPEPTAAPTADGQVADAGPRIPTLLIVRTGTLQLTVPDLDAAIRDGDAAVGRAGGYVSGSNRTADDGHGSAQVTYRIPSAEWTPTLATLRGLASTVLSEQVKTDEVSGQVVDLTARIANLRATEAALQAIMAKAEEISDVLAVQEQLTTTRGEIERLVGEKAGLEDLASFGSLDVTFRLAVAATPKPTPVATKGWDPGDDVARASGKLVRIGQASTSAAIWVSIIGLPIALAGAVALVVAWQLFRAGRWLARRRDGFGADA